MFEEHPFLKLVKEGKIEFTKEGKIIGFREYAILIPVRVINRLYLILKEKLPGEFREILKKLGKFQIRQALSRYIKTLGWSSIEKQKFLEFGFTFLTSSLGLGNFTVHFKGKKFFITTSKTPFAEEFVLEYGKQEEPIDYYLCGMWEEVFTIFTGKPMVCEEVKCYAKGDDCCEFVVRPKEEIEKENK